MAAPAIDPAMLIVVASFGFVTALSWALLEMFGSRKPRVEERLEELQHASWGAGRDERSQAPGAMSQWLHKASPQLAKPLQPRSDADAGVLRLRLARAGFRDPNAVTMYLGLKALGCLAALFLGGGWVLLTSGGGLTAMTRLLLIVLGAFMLPDLVLWFITSRRKRAIFLGLPDALDLLVISVEAGLGLDQAMQKVAGELGKSHPLLAREFKTANHQLHMGRTRVEVLRDLGQRNGEQDLETLASVLIQACKFGSGIGPALRTQSDAMRIRRRQLAEEKAAKCAVKLIFPLVLFIFPGIFVVLVGPAAISIIRNFLPMGDSM